MQNFSWFELNELVIFFWFFCLFVFYVIGAIVSSLETFFGRFCLADYWICCFIFGGFVGPCGLFLGFLYGVGAAIFHLLLSVKRILWCLGESNWWEWKGEGIELYKDGATTQWQIWKLANFSPIPQFYTNFQTFLIKSSDPVIQ